MNRAYLALIRPANVATALADVLAGFGVAGLAAPWALPWLLLSTACLYAGGVVFNDVFDRHLDAVERPERPLPSGRVAVRNAVLIGTAALLVGIGAAAAAGVSALALAVAIAALVLFYDAWGKRHSIIGPVNMGLCRGFNLMLGVAVSPAALQAHWPLAAIPVTYIAAVTLLSRGEVRGGARSTGRLALALVCGVLVALTVLSVQARGSTIGGLALTALLAWRVVPPFLRAAQAPAATAIRQAVGIGVLSLVLVDGVIATVNAGMIYGLALLATALLAGRLARAFAVT